MSSNLAKMELIQYDLYFLLISVFASLNMIRSILEKLILDTQGQITMKSAVASCRNSKSSTLLRLSLLPARKKKIRPKMMALLRLVTTFSHCKSKKHTKIKGNEAIRIQIQASKQNEKQLQEVKIQVNRVSSCFPKGHSATKTELK